jgi:hypothetical protein
MFYEVAIPEMKGKKIAAMVTLLPAESRRLLAKATVAIPEVQNAWKNGTLIIGRGITNAYVTEELLGIKIEPKAGQTIGLVANGITDANDGPPPCTAHVFRKGQIVQDADATVEIQSFGPDDVMIKGANAVDPTGAAGILSSSTRGGTWGMFTPWITTRNAQLIIPVGLEKLVPSVSEAFDHSGIYYFKFSLGLPAKLVPTLGGKVITEIQALAFLAGVKAYQIGAGGVGGSEGAVVLSLEGSEEAVTKAFELVKSLKGEPPVTLPGTYYVGRAEDFRFDALAQLATLQGA